MQAVRRPVKQRARAVHAIAGFVGRPVFVCPVLLPVRLMDSARPRGRQRRVFRTVRRRRIEMIRMRVSETAPAVGVRALRRVVIMDRRVTAH